MNKISKIIFYSVFFIPVILLTAFFFCLIAFNETAEEVVMDHDLTENFASKVDSLYYDKQNHNVKIALLASGYKYPIFRKWESKIQIGDSLSKRKGSFKLIIYKNNNTKTTLDYRGIYKK